MPERRDQTGPDDLDWNVDPRSASPGVAKTPAPAPIPRERGRTATRRGSFSFSRASALGGLALGLGLGGVGGYLAAGWLHGDKTAQTRAARRPAGANVPDQASPHETPPVATGEATASPAARRAEGPAPAREGLSAHDLLFRGNELAKQGDPRGAIRSYEAALRINPRLSQAYRALGPAYARAGNKAAAIRSLREYLRLRPRAPDAPEVQRSLRSLGAAR